MFYFQDKASLWKRISLLAFPTKQTYVREGDTATLTISLNTSTQDLVEPEKKTIQGFQFQNINSSIWLLSVFILFIFRWILIRRLKPNIWSLPQSYNFGFGEHSVTSSRGRITINYITKWLWMVHLLKKVQSVQQIDPITNQDTTQKERNHGGGRKRTTLNFC